MKTNIQANFELPRVEILNRRDFLKMTGGGITVFFSLVPLPSAYSQAAPKSQGFPKMGGPMGAAADINAYLRIGEDGKVTVFSGKVELGQCNTIALAQMAAEELRVPLESVEMIMGDTDLCPWDMGTFGSMSIRVYGAALRAAAAEARAILLEMAADRLQASKSQLKIHDGVVFVENDSSRRVTFAQLTGGQKITRKLEQKSEPKAPSEFTVIGKSPARPDAEAKVTGKAKFAGDIRFPDMLYAKVLRPPVHGAVVKNADTSAAEKFAGVQVVKEDGLVAVLHPDPETAEKALAAIKADFDLPSLTLDQETIFDYLLDKAPKPQQSERKGNLAEGEKSAVATFEAKYLNGYGAHAPVETHTACARFENGKMTVWASTQTPFPNQQEIARALKIASQNVRVITPYVGGAFGGKSSDPQAVEAARLAMITGKPVQVCYTRAEEFFYDAFRPAAIVRIRSGLDRGGKICLWDYHVYSAGSRSAEQFYDVPNNLMSVYGNWMGDSTKIHPFAVGPWRAPGANINVFARESQIDIMASKGSEYQFLFMAKGGGSANKTFLFQKTRVS